MSIIQPNGKIWLCKNVPLNPSMSDTLYFLSESDRYNYFINHSDISFTNVSYMRVQDGVIRLQVNPERVYNYNYMMFTNTGFSNRYFFAFIIGVNYVNNNTAEITFELDPMITWFFDYHLKECYVEREHASTDTVGSNIIGEDFNFVTYNTVQQHSLSFNDFGGTRKSYILGLINGLVNSQTGTLDMPEPGNYSGTFCGLGFFEYESDNITAMRSLLLNYYVNYPDSIIAMFSIPKWLHDNCTSQTDYHGEALQDMQSTTALDGGYIPRNKKLYTYPYNKCVVGDNNGNELDLEFEFFPNRRVIMKVEGIKVPNPEIIAYPYGYKGVQSDLSQALSWTDFPKLAWGSDYFKEWYNQNISKLNASIDTAFINATAGVLAPTSSMLGSVGKAMKNTAPIKENKNGTWNKNSMKRYAKQSAAIGKIALGSVGAIATNAVVGGIDLFNEVINVNATIDSAHAMPNKTHGSFATSNMNVGCTEKWKLTMYQKSLPREFLSSIDDYFDMFGYATKRVKIPNTWVRQHWTYTKTIGCQISGELPADDMETICEIYDSGIRFWLGNADGSDVVGQFNLSNNVL